MIKDLKQKLERNKEVYFNVKVSPGAPKSQFKELMADGTLKIAIAGVPEKGKANLELIKFLSKEFEVSKKMVYIISGSTDRFKLIKIIK